MQQMTAMTAQVRPVSAAAGVNLPTLRSKALRELAEITISFVQKADDAGTSC